MTDRTVTHATFVIERTYDAAPARVFAAFADLDSKRRWFGDPEQSEGVEYTLDFNVGGREHIGGRSPGGPAYTFDALYQDIVPGQRIVTTYDMHMDGARISVSLATVELTPAGRGTLLVYTEQGAFLDGLDTPAIREHGTREVFEALDGYLQRQTAPKSPALEQI
jgi:uncharacterized protein YndB with AHSA1/START domain